MTRKYMTYRTAFTILIALSLMAQRPTPPVSGAPVSAGVLKSGPPEAYPVGVTPGVTNPSVTQANIAATICKSGWTKTIRPPASYTNKLKLQQMKDLGLTGKPSDYEEDHKISLEIGGHPTDPGNLWPEPYAGQYGARIKDQVEDKLHRLVCSDTWSLTEAQTCIADDWVACGVRIGVVK